MISTIMTRFIPKNIRLIQKGPFASLLARLPVGARGIMMVPQLKQVIELVSVRGHKMTSE